MLILALVVLKNKRRRSTFTSHNKDKDKDNQARATTPEQAQKRNHEKDATLKQTSGMCILHAFETKKEDRLSILTTVGIHLAE